MDFSLAYIKNNQQFMLQHYNSDPSDQRARHLGLEELKNQQVQAIFVPQLMMNDDYVAQVIEEECKYFAFRPVEADVLSEDSFDNLDRNHAWSLFHKTHSSWVLKNNLELLEKLAPTTNHLKSLWANERTTFFEELWYLLKKNLGAQNLRIAYNHLQKAQKEGEKNKLIRVVVEGNKTPQPVENKELGELLFKNYEGKFADHFSCYDIQSPEKSTFLITINDSPVIVMAEMLEITKLQQALMIAFFDALQIS